MKSLIVLVAALLLTAFVGSTFAADKPAAPDKKVPTVKGDLVKVDGTKVIFKTKNADKETTVETNAKTEVIIEGTAGKLADLKVGQKIVVTATDGVATRIEVPKPKPAKKPDAK